MRTRTLQGLAGLGLTLQGLVGLGLMFHGLVLLGLVLSIGFGAPAARAEVLALTGGTVHPVSGPEIANGTVLVDGT